MKQKPKDEQVIDILKRLAKRIEVATVDIHEIKTDLKMVKLRLQSLEHDTGIMKVDMEYMKGDIQGLKKDVGIIKVEIGIMKKDIKDLKRNTEDLMENDAEILTKMVTQDELKSLSKRVSALEHQ